MSQQPIVMLSGRCTKCGERVECRLGNNADRCACGGLLLDLTMLGRAWRQAGSADDLQTVRGLPMSEAPRDRTVIRAWTYPDLQEVLIQWDVEDADSWECAGEGEPRWLSDENLLCWVTFDEK